MTARLHIASRIPTPNLVIYCLIYTISPVVIQKPSQRFVTTSTDHLAGFVMVGYLIPS